MIRPQDFIKIIILVSTILSASTEYRALYLMEFENINKDFTINHLQKAFPDLIKENYRVIPFEVEQYICLGTLQDLKVYNFWSDCFYDKS